MHGSIVKMEAKLNAKEKEISIYKSKASEAVNRSRGLESELSTMKEELRCLKLGDKKQFDEDEDQMMPRQRGSSNGLASEMGESESRRNLIEKVARLERENTRLKEDLRNGGGGTGGGSDNNSSEQLLDEIRLKNRYQKDSMEANAKVEALELEIKMMKENGESNSSSGKNTAFIENMKKSYDTKIKSISDKYDRLKKKNDEENSKNATLKHSMIELEQKIGDMMEEQKSKETELNTSDEANEKILKKLKSLLREKEEQCDQLAIDKGRLEKYVQKALQTVHVKYKEACSKLQQKLDFTETKLKESDAKVSLTIFLYLFFLCTIKIRTPPHPPTHTLSFFQDRAFG